jgi:hypothetical protein
MMKSIALTEASELEIKAVISRYEPPMLIAIERARRDAIRNGRDALKTILGDEQVNAIFNEVVEAVLVAIDRDAAQLAREEDAEAMPVGSRDINSRVQQHCGLAKDEAREWFVSLVAHLVPGVGQQPA